MIMQSFLKLMITDKLIMFNWFLKSSNKQLGSNWNQKRIKLIFLFMNYIQQTYLNFGYFNKFILKEEEMNITSKSHLLKSTILM